MSNAQNFKRSIFFIVGAAAVCFAVVVPSASYANFLLGENPKDLSFGPALFRTLLFLHGILLIALGLFWKNKIEAKAQIETEKTSLLTMFILIVLTAFALALRLWNLNSDLWVDEVYTLVDFVRIPFAESLTSFPSQNQHLLYTILAHASIEIFGESAWALRLPAALFGAASVPALFLLARKLLGERESLLACALMTVSYHHVWFSQNARGYTGLLLFTILATWAWLEALEKNDWRRWMLYAAAVVFGMWVHMTMAFVVAAHGLVHLSLLFVPKLSGDENDFSLERRAGLKPFAAWFLSVTVTAQLYALALPEFLREGLHEESRNSEWTNPLWVLTEIFTNLSIGFAGIVVVLLGAAFVAFGWFSLFKKNRRAAVLMILPPFFAGALMLALGHNLFPRFFFFAMGFGLIIVVHGALELPKVLFKVQSSKFQVQIPEIANRKSQIANRIGYSLALLIIAASLLTVPRNYALPKQDFSGAKNYVETNRQPNDEVVAVSIAGDIYERYFASNFTVAKTGADLEKIENTGERIWLIYTLSPEIKAFRPEVWQLIERDYETVKIFPGTLNGGEIFVCRRRGIGEKKNETSKNLENGKNDTF
jgi:mannosyltransferase